MPPVQMSLEQARLAFPPMWTIYDRPLDYPKNIVVRVWYGLVPAEHTLHDSVAEARESITRRGGSVSLSRQPGDDPKIVETWI